MLIRGLGLLARAAAAWTLVSLFAAGCYFTPPPCGGRGEACCSSGAHCGSGMSCDGVFYPTCETCGGAGQACCSAGATCASGLACTSGSFGASRCTACGGVGQPCCGSTCASGLACRGGTCATCGESGQPCCPGSQCLNDLGCTDTGLCGTCGFAGDICCAGGACVSPAHCEGASGRGRCTVCGGPGEPCCGGSRCDAVTSSCLDGTCQPCGALRGACCAGGTCPISGTCVAGVCSAVVADAGRPDAGASDASTADAMPTDVTSVSGACLPGSCDYAGMVCVPFPVAICSHPCTTDADCGAAGVCFSGTCAPTCRPGRADCDPYGGICFTAPVAYPVIAGTTITHACIPSCFPDGVAAPAGFPSCAPGSVCDPATGGCVAASSTIVLGAPCTGSSDCAGSCIRSTSTSAAATGFVGGYCAAFARNPGTAAFAPGAPLPRSNCPPGGVAIPSATAGLGDAVYCYAECVDDCDCRVGYRCDHNPLRLAGEPAPNGACLPIDCGQPSMPCPAGTTCGSFAWSTYLHYPVCVPASDGGVVATEMNTGCSSAADAGFDASLDATAGD